MHIRSHIRRDYFSSNEDWEGDPSWNDSDALFNVETWAGPNLGIEAYGIALQKLPTEEDLVTMEETEQDDLALDGPLWNRERRSGLRH